MSDVTISENRNVTWNESIMWYVICSPTDTTAPAVSPSDVLYNDKEMLGECTCIVRDAEVL